MFITSITIENFKGIRDRVTIDLKPITLLFGPNSAGKSTIIQALHYAWEVIGRHNLDPNFTEFGGREMDLGGFENLVYGHDLSRSIAIRVDMDISKTTLPFYSDDPQLIGWHQAAGIFDHENIFCWNFNHCAGSWLSSLKIENVSPSSAWVELEISWDNNNKKAYVSNYEVGFDNEPIARIKSSLKENKVYINYINFSHWLLTFPSKRRMEQAFKEILNDDTKNIGEFDRAFYFKDLIENAYLDPESWLDPNFFTPEEYIILSELVYSYKEADNSDAFLEINSDKETKLKNIIDEIYPSLEKTEKEDGEKFVKEILKISEAGTLKDKRVREYLRDKNSLSSEYDLYSPFFPYEFLFFCLQLLPSGSLSQNFKIPLKQDDALPKWDIEDFLTISFDAPMPEHTGEYPRAINSALTQFIVGPGQLLKNEIKKLSYLGPIRSRIPRNYVPNRYVEKQNWPDGLAAWDVLHKKEEEIVKQTDFWMADRLNSGYHITRKTYKEIDVDRLAEKQADLQAIYNTAPAKTRLFLMDQKSGVEVQPPDVGVGISQVIPVIVSALYFKDGIVTIEQPELHIHPALQVTLGDLFISQIQKEEPPCFILETHSEHLMLRFLRSIRETGEGKLSEGRYPLTPDQLAIYYIEPGKNGLTVSRIRVDQDGEFMDRWPRGFFNERVEELY